MSQKSSNIISKKFNKRWYDKHAYSVVEILQENGFKAYFVGGCVRDMLLGQKAKDFDVLTDARPAAIAALFKNSRLIGRRFPIVHITFGRHFIETTSMMPAQDPWYYRWFSRKVYGSLVEDAQRRDFTVNAMYYDPVGELLHDPLHALEDIEHKRLKMIGSIVERMKEDPLRMLRAIRISGKTGLKMDASLIEAFPHITDYLHAENDQRVYLEWVKMILSGSALPSYHILQSMPQCFSIMLPSLQEIYQVSVWRRIGSQLIERALAAIDERFQNNKTVSLVFALSIFFWLQIDKMVRDKVIHASEPNIASQLTQIMLPLRVPVKVREGISEIYAMQYAMKHRSSQNVSIVMRHPRFRASYDFLMLRAASDLKVMGLASWWHDFIHGDEMIRAYMMREQDEYHARPQSPMRNKTRRKPYTNRKK